MSLLMTSCCDDHYYWDDYNDGDELIELIDMCIYDMNYNYHFHNRETFFTYNGKYAVTRIGRIIKIDIIHNISYNFSKRLMSYLNSTYRYDKDIREIYMENRDLVVLDCRY